MASADDALSVMRQVKPDVLIVARPDDDDFAFIRQVRSLKPEDGGVVPANAIARDVDDDLARARADTRPISARRWTPGSLPARVEPDDGAVMVCLAVSPAR